MLKLDKQMIGISWGKYGKICPERGMSSSILFEIEDDMIKYVKFFNGCNRNLKAVSLLVQGMHIDEVILRLEGIDCNGKGTSCPDQFSKALKEYKNKNRK